MPYRSALYICEATIAKYINVAFNNNNLLNCVLRRLSLTYIVVMKQYIIIIAEYCYEYIS